MMSKYAIISGDIVDTIIVADSLEEASVLGFAVEYTDENPAFIGGKYDAETGKFSNPLAEEPVKEEELNA
jgi:hypothetical protein